MKNTAYSLPCISVNLTGVFAFIVMITVSACDQAKEPASSGQKNTSQPVAGYNPYKDSEITVEVFKVDSIEHNGLRGWGYDILVDGKIYIHQPNIPAIMGNNGFSSEENALTAGEFIVKKIRNNILPPAVTPEELDSLGVLN